MLVDTNLLVYAFRRESPEHGAARAWLSGLLHRDGALLLTSMALVAFVRLTTSRRIIRDPVGTDEALDFVAALRRDPGARAAEPGAGYAAIFDDLCRERNLRGNDIPDVHLAAIAIEHRAILATHDRGFDRFPGLRTFDPLA